jgi:hypothetical protein
MDALQADGIFVQLLRTWTTPPVK